jgi:hypothetical protein
MPAAAAANIREVPDVCRPGDGDDGCMISIRMESKDPPCGEAAAHGSEPVRFEGWLGMMRVLADLVARTESVAPELVGWPDPSAGRFHRELDPGRDTKLAEYV